MQLFRAAGISGAAGGGLHVDRIGASSVQYGVAIFREGAGIAAAAGHFVHAHVDRESRQPVPLSLDLRAQLEANGPPK
jgi:acyl-CoA thioester hydrolase